MQTDTRCFASQDRRWLVLAFLTLLLIALPARAQDVTIEEKQTLDELEFTYDLTIGNRQLFAGGDALVHYFINGIGQAVSPATIPYNGDPVALAATDALLAVGDFASTLTLFDITDPNNPVQRGTANTAGATLDIVARGNFVFTTPDIFTANNVVEIFDVSDPDNPVRVSQYRPGAFADALFLADSGTELLVATEEKLEIVDVSDPANPTLLGSVALAGRGAEVTMLGTTAFVGSQQPENPQTAETPGWFLEAFDVSDPGNPQLLAATGDNDGPMHALIRLEEAFLVTSSPTGLQVFSFEASTGAFKTMDTIVPRGDLTGTSPTALTTFSPTDLPDLPNNCIPVYTNASTTLPPGTATGNILSGGDGPSKDFQVKVPPGTEAVLITSYATAPRVECPAEPGAGINIGGEP